MSRMSSRTRILDGASEILDSGPYGEFTVDNLARALRMSKSTLYKYFYSKEAVVDTLVQETCERTDGLLQGLGTDVNSPADIDLQRFLEIYGQHADNLPRSILVERKKMPSSTQARLLMTRVNLDTACTRVLTKGKQQGTLRVEDPGLMASIIVASMEAAQEAAARRNKPGARSAATRMVTDLVLPGLRAR